MLSRIWIFSVFVLLIATFSVHADDTFYLIKMDDQPVGYVHYTVEKQLNSLPLRESMSLRKSMFIYTTVYFTSNQAGLEQRIKLTAESELQTETYLPKHYHLATFINGFSQSTIETNFTSNTAQQVIHAAGQEFPNSISLPGPTYLVDNNFRVDLYNYVLQKYDTSHKDVQNFQILIPLMVPQLPSALTFTVKWVGEENLILDDREFVTYHLEGVVAGTTMDFWIAKDDKQIVKWIMPFGEVTLADEAIVSEGLVPWDVSDIVRRAAGQSIIPTDVDMGNLYDITYLKTRIDLETHTEEFITDTSNQNFDGAIDKEEGSTHITGEFTMRASEYSGENAPVFPVQSISSDDIPDDAEIVQHAKALTEVVAEVAKTSGPSATVKTTWEATQTVVDWVFRSIKYAAVETSAKECFTQRRGNAASKATLTVALLRALNIPARVVGGVLYVNGAFVPHYWTEVNMGAKDGWISVDAATGESRQFNAGHIALWRGSGKLTPDVFSSMKIDVVDYQTSATTWQDLLPLQVGEHNRYVFHISNNEAGDNTVDILDTITYQGTECYEIHSTVNLNSHGESDDQHSQISGQSTMYLSKNGITLFYELDLHINGQKEHITYTREGNTLHLTRQIGLDAETQADFNVNKKTFFISDNTPWHWDMVFRQQELSTGQQLVIEAFNPQTATPQEYTITISNVETIEAGGQQYECFKAETEGYTFWVSPIGRVIKYAVPKQDLVVELE